MSDTRFLNFRLREPLKSRVASFEGGTGVSATSLAEELLRAAMDYFEKHRELTVPLVVLPKSAVDRHGRPRTDLTAASLTDEAGVERAAATLNAIAAKLGIPIEAKLPKQPTTKSAHRSR
jgi:sugar phosphate isomerase/epimerase